MDMDYIHDDPNKQQVLTRTSLGLSTARKKRCRYSEHKQAYIDQDSDTPCQKRKRHQLSDLNQAQNTIFGKSNKFVHTSNTAQIVSLSSTGAASATITTVSIQAAS